MQFDWVTVGGWIFSVITAVIAYFASTRAHRDTTKDSDKSIYVTAITNERAKWRDELRKSVAEFARLSIEQTPNLPELIRTKTEIILRLNPRAKDIGMGEKHKFDLQLMNATNEIFAALSAAEPKNVTDLVNALEASAQELLKQEWDKSKDEAFAGSGRAESHR